MDILPKLRSLHLTRLQSRRTRLIRRWLAVGLLVLGGVLLVHPGSARGAPTVLAAHDLPSGTTLRPADVRLAEPASVLADRATVAPAARVAAISLERPVAVTLR